MCFEYEQKFKNILMRNIKQIEKILNYSYNVKICSNIKKTLQMNFCLCKRGLIHRIPPGITLL